MSKSIFEGAMLENQIILWMYSNFWSIATHSFNDNNGEKRFSVEKKFFLLCDKMWAIHYDTIEERQQNDVDPSTVTFTRMDWQAEKSEIEKFHHMNHQLEWWNFFIKTYVYIHF